MSVQGRFVDGGSDSGGSVRTKRWLVALDIDGTTMREDGVVTETVVAALRDAEAAGHEVMLSTGRSEGMTVPLLETLGIRPKYLVCANGALTLARRSDGSYERVHVERFDPSEVLQTVHGALEHAAFGVEDEAGHFLLSGNFPDDAMTVTGEHVPFERLLGVEATRVVVISPDHATEDFLSVVDRMGLHKVSYNVGWTAWLDIAPDGVTKATGLQFVTDRLGIPSSRVLAIGDGRNDIDMLQWAVAGGGLGVAMGQAPDEVAAVATERTGTDVDDGVALTLARYFQG
jgi:Cof subfamily protein (haloacid dehalogenase superfamily)